MGLGLIQRKKKILEKAAPGAGHTRIPLRDSSGRAVSKEEALKILRDAEQNGLVHVTMNKAHAGHFICNCWDCCCQAFPLLISEGLSLCDPSRLQAEIDPVPSGN